MMITMEKEEKGGGCGGHGHGEEEGEEGRSERGMVLTMEKGRQRGGGHGDGEKEGQWVIIFLLLERGPNVSTASLPRSSSHPIGSELGGNTPTFITPKRSS